jgi:hypothetical protein
MTIRVHTLGYILLGLLGVFPGDALAQNSSAVFPREGAKKVTPAEGDSPYISVWDVTWKKGQSTGLMSRPFDQVTVTLSEGAVKVTRPDKTSTIEFSRFGSVQFEPKGVVTAEEGASDQPRRAMVFQLKTYDLPVKPDIAKFMAQKKAEGVPGQLDPANNATKLFENDRIIVWDKRYKGGPVHVHYTWVAGVWIQGGKISSFSPDGKLAGGGRTNYAGEIRFHEPGSYHREDTTEDPRAIWIQYKDSTGRP